MQCGTTQLLYISSASANLIHITSKQILGNQCFFFLFFPLFLFFFSPCLLQCKTVQLLCNLDKNPMHTWWRPIYTQVAMANWKADSGIPSNVCVVDVMSQPTASAERFPSGQVAALELCWPLMIEWHDERRVSPRLIISVVWSCCFFIFIARISYFSYFFSLLFGFCYFTNICWQHSTCSL